MKLINILNYPSYYKNRKNSLNFIPLEDIDYNFIDNRYVITANAISSKGNNKYDLMLIIDGEEIKQDSKIRVNCSCLSFQYEFQYVIAKNDGLVYTDIEKKRPMKRNIYSHLTACKHIIRLGQLIFRRKNLIKPIESKIKIIDDYENKVKQNKQKEQFDWLNH